MPFCGRFWCDFCDLCGLCGLVNTPRFYYVFFFFNIMLTWKIVVALKASVLYVYIDGCVVIDKVKVVDS